MLAAAGTGLGVLLAAVTASVIPRLAPPELPLAGVSLIDETVLLFAAVASVVVALLVGGLPALTVVRADPAVELGSGRSGGVRGAGVRRTLAVAQLAVSIVLLVGAGLLTSTFVRLQRVEPVCSHWTYVEGTALRWRTRC